MSALTSPEVNDVLQRSKQIAHEAGHEYVGTEHILAALSMVSGTPLADVLTDRGVTAERIVTEIQNLGAWRSVPLEKLQYSPRALAALCRGLELMNWSGSVWVTNELLLIAVIESLRPLNNEGRAINVLSNCGVDPGDLMLRCRQKFHDQFGFMPPDTNMTRISFP